jgi:hypothetical protein
MISDFNTSVEQNSEGSLLRRRSFLGLISLSVASVITGVESVHAGLFYSTRAVDGIPDEWVKEKGVEVLRYANYIKSIKLKNITPYMVLRPHFKVRDGVANSLPPRHLWKSLVMTLRVIDRLAYEINSPIKELVSIYRSPIYNSMSHGTSQSKHLENMAVDVTFTRSSSYTASRKVKEMQAKGYFKGGIGTYANFLHVDTRGENVSW